MLPVSLLDGDPHGLTTVFSFYDFLLQAMEPDARIYDLTYEFVFANEDAAFGVVAGVASVDADAAEVRNTEQYGQPCLEFWRI
jgi:hypothetical protein